MSKSRGAEDQVFEDFQGERIELNMRKNIQQRLSEPQCQPILSSSTPSQNLLKEDSAGSPMVSCIFSHQCVEAGRLLVHLENALSNSAVGSLKYGAVRTHTQTQVYIYIHITISYYHCLFYYVPLDCILFFSIIFLNLISTEMQTHVHVYKWMHHAHTQAYVYM